MKFEDYRPNSEEEPWVSAKKKEIAEAVLQHYEHWLDPHGPGIPVTREGITTIVNFTADSLLANISNSSATTQQTEQPQGE